MKACFALLVDNEIHNYSRNLAFAFDRKYNTGFISASLPQHITLGPVFEVKNIEEVENYFDYVAKNLKPFEVLITDIDLKILGDEEAGFGIIWMNIKESIELRELHNTIYKYITEHSWDTDNNDKYHFHSTIALGKQPANVYKELYQCISDKKINHNCIINELAMFCTTDSENKMGTYITFKILNINNK
ncbi:2'-5' RNA ligase family protein [Clostridium estertheticum]|uniref:2'-5' RNA ligase family protein n=1 Tax=Clostridium estertheticum TaxID=238834 RepID=UPI0013E999AE|nr:2'-5' RNA ligase family protein [Clostridium estertheticum]MBZ9689713.1 2'-5' RNA ligase family protein [Clostridium estertheticum]